MNVSGVLRNRSFAGYLAGVVLSQIGTRGAMAASLYQVYELSGSLATTGLVGAAGGVAVLVLSPVGGALADRMDRRRLLQMSQAAGGLVALVLAVLTLTDQVRAWHVVLASLLSMAATTFDNPTRAALIGSMVPKEQLPQAFALVNPAREVAVLVGPGLAGLLIAAGGPGVVHAVDAATYAAMIVVLLFVRTPSEHVDREHAPILRAIAEGARYVAGQRIILLLMSLDLSAMIFGAYRVLLPAIALDVLDVGPRGYGLLAAAPSAGAVLATYGIVKALGRSQQLGRVLLLATGGFALADVVLAQSRSFVLTLVAALCLGVADALATSIRHAAVQIETPDELRGRVSSIYQMSSRGGPAMGDAFVGALAGALGPAIALTVGAGITLSYITAMLARDNPVRRYSGPDRTKVPVG
ncbi:MFS transporter [Nocardioides panacis]|uniref:MFS transporter n=1 Tax=Nocardioides panacis TaxID=2849501 RepID=A0A975Y240_9ACTN|nr:MFS transporter [Nocardioides panacis]QWZ10160.1 MFS transporter [Nocardioides panacis]